MMRQTYQAETEDVKWFDLEKAKEFKAKVIVAAKQRLLKPDRLKV